MKFLLTPSGLRNDSLALALEELTGKPLRETSVLFVTTAANTGVDDKRWLIENLHQLERYNFSNIDIIDFAGLPEAVYRPHFEKADVICVSGGDERYLAQMMQAHNMGAFLVSLLESKVYLGISAGSMVLGHLLSVSTTKQLYPEEDFGDTKGEGLGLLPITYIPHLNSEFFLSLRRPLLESVKESFNWTTYVTDDETALKINGDEITVVGTGESIIFKKYATK